MSVWNSNSILIHSLRSPVTSEAQPWESHSINVYLPPDGRPRCGWSGAAPEFLAYHGDAGIVRHRGKIEAVINNAARAVELQSEAGSLAAYFWRYELPAGEVAAPQTVSTSPSSIALSKDLKKRGWKFVGPTTVFAFMQAMGLVNDHAEECVIRPEATSARAEFVPPLLSPEE